MPSPSSPTATISPGRRRRLPEEAGIFLVLVVVVLVFAFLSPSFRTVSNGSVVLVNGTVIAFLALGQTFVLLTGGIDLSTGANIGMTGVIAALLMQLGLPWPLAALLALAAATVLGLINGILTHFLRIPAFIATFSTQGVALAVPLIITGAQSISVHDRGFSWIGQGKVLGMPAPVLLVLGAAVLAGIFLRMTRLGVHIYALGGNRAAARLVGVNVATTTLFVYGVSGFCGGMGGLIATSRLMVGFPATGTGNELFYSIAAAVVGGVSLFGGVGTVFGAMIGAVLIAVVSNGMNVINVQSYWQSLVIGVIILLGVTFDTYRRSARIKAARSFPTNRPAGGEPPSGRSSPAKNKSNREAQPARELPDHPRSSSTGGTSMKKLFPTAALTGAGALTLLAFGNPAYAAAKLPASCSDAKPAIGVALPNTVNPYYIAMQDSFKKHGAELGYTVNVAIANDNDSNQLSQIDAFIQQGVCAVVLNAVNSGPGAASVKALNDAGIPVFTVNVIVSADDLKAQGASFVEYVGADQVAGGTQIGEQVLKDLGSNASIVAGIVGDPDQIPTNQRDKGFTDAISKSSNAKVVGTVNSKVDPNVSLQVTGDLLQGHPDINLIWADTGPGAVGALQAITQQGKADTVKLYAFCAADTALTPTYAACAAQEPADYARIALENLKKYLGGADVPAQVLQPLKIFLNGQKPGPGEVG